MTKNKINFTVYTLFWNESVKLKTLQFYQRPWMIVFGYMLKHTSTYTYKYI